MKSNNNIFLTGQAGTGKSTTIKNYLKWAEENNLLVVLTASTGVAALNIGGVTIHSFLGSKLSNTIDEYKKIKISPSHKKKLKDIINEMKVLVIDEISMLPSSYIDMIDYILKKYTNEPDLPFGGKKVILTGDFLQLPPIGRTTRKFAFESKAWKEAEIIAYNLTKIHRQKDETFTYHLSKIRMGENEWETIKYFDNINYDIIENDNSVKLFSRNINVDDYNTNKLELIDGESFFYEAILTGSSSEKSNITKRVLANETLELKVGAKVMALKNDLDLSYVNGSTGMVVELTNKSVKVKFDNGYIATLTKDKWESLDVNGNILAIFEQIPLKLAYAITIHKSQGMTIDNLTIDCEGIFEEGQFYVAISRAKTKEGLKLIGFEPRHIIANKKAVYFYKKFNN
ncbi:MAG: AAA family ATPase [Mycoplasmataceae bacterium]|nr:AAA family ATPase [Mycoplasmataceae bacterium]